MNTWRWSMLVCGLAALAVPAAFGQVGTVERPRAAAELSRQLDVPRGRASQIGVSVRDLDEAELAREKLPGSGGVVIEDVRSESPAARAGLKAGDVIVEFDGERVRSARQFARLVQETPPGRRVPGVLLRSGRRIEFQVTPEPGAGLVSSEALERLQSLRWELPRVEWPFEVEVRMRPARLGASVTGLTRQLADYFGVKGGVLVTSVDPDTPAARAGLQAGDVITAVDDQPVDDTTDLRRHLARTERGAEVTLGVVRNRQPLKLNVRLDDGGRARRAARLPVD